VPRPTIPLAELVTYLFGPGPSWLATEVGPRLSDSQRFRGFAETYRDKIRKKARGVRDEEGRRDLAFELAVAYRLLEDPRFAVEYESYGARQRAPDFRVTFRTRLHLNIEVRRLRHSASTADAQSDNGRLIRAITDKLGQLPPAMINVLVLGTDDSGADGIASAMRWLQDRAASREDTWFVQRGFAGTRDFLRRYQRLSAALWLSADGSVSLWRNGQARHPLPPDLTRALTNPAP
jgi:hypothetical protein